MTIITSIIRFLGYANQTTIGVLTLSGRNSLTYNRTAGILSKMYHLRTGICLLVIIGYRHAVKLCRGVIARKNTGRIFPGNGRTGFHLRPGQFAIYPFAVSAFRYEIIHAAFAFGINPDQGADLIFVTLPNVFNAMPGGRLWGALFFVFLFFAALSTITAVFENILACWMDRWNISRGKAVAANLVLIFVLSLPFLLSNNLWSGLKILGMSIMDFEDFLVTSNLLPIGSMVYLMFCCLSKKVGWGFDNFLTEADQGKGARFPARFRVYFTYILPLIVLFIFIVGYWDKFGPKS